MRPIPFTPSQPSAAAAAAAAAVAAAGHFSLRPPLASSAHVPSQVPPGTAAAAAAAAVAAIGIFPKQGGSLVPGHSAQLPLPTPPVGIPYPHEVFLTFHLQE